MRRAEPGLVALQERTEGWAAGLRLAAQPDPEGFVAGFSGSERTVAEYLLAEVLERVNGELADLLTGRSGGGRIFQVDTAAHRSFPRGRARLYLG